MTTPYYQDDLVTLYHGDCLEETAWLDADVLVTDPPYGIAWKSNDTHASRGKSVEASRELVAGDDSSNVRDLALSLWGDGPAIVFGSWRVKRPDRTSHRLIWHKASRLPGYTSAPFFPAEEEIYIIGSGFIGRPIQNVITTHEKRDGKYGEVAKIGHPTPKPVGLMEKLVAKTVGIIADPFAGSGATLIAARNLGRQSIAVEIEERYCELIAKRLAQQAFNFGEPTE